MPIVSIIKRLCCDTKGSGLNNLSLSPDMQTIPSASARLRELVIFLNLTEGVGLVLEVADQELKVSYLTQLDVCREAHAHLQG